MFRIFLSFALVLVISGIACAQGDFGVGVVFGEPTGVSFKSWLDERAAVDAAAAWSFADRSSFQIHADYLLHDFGLLIVKPGKLPIYYGLGGRARFRENDTDIGVRIPVGLSYIFATAPLDIFLELAPILDLVPATEFDLNGGIGIRFWFK